MQLFRAVQTCDFEAISLDYLCMYVPLATNTNAKSTVVVAFVIVDEKVDGKDLAYTVDRTI